MLEWALTAAALALVLAAPGLDLGDLGFGWPRASAYTLVGTLGLVLSVGLLVGLRRRVDRGAHGDRAGRGGRPAAADGDRAARLRPAGADRRVLRGGALPRLPARGRGAEAPELGPGRLVLVSALAFAVAHTYQGVVGMLTAGVLGAGFAVLFLGTGSLLLPVLFHTLIDLRLLVLSVRSPRHRAGPAPTFSPRRPPGARADSPRGPA